MKARRGLTLIELVVTLVIASLAMISAYTALTTLVDRRENALEVFDRAIAAAELRKTLEHWIGGAELTIEEDDVLFRGLDGQHTGLPDDVLVLRTGAATPTTDPGATLRLFVDRNDSTPAQGLSVEVRRSGELTAHVFELEPRVVSLDIRYMSSLLGPPEWGTSWVSATLLPVAAELRLAGVHADSLSEVLRLPILVPIRVP